MIGGSVLEGSGHWIWQEQPEAVSSRLIDFLRAAAWA
jgi:pimeloyl-ACP methyl ester carboxylesterase